MYLKHPSYKGDHHHYSLGKMARFQNNEADDVRKSWRRRWRSVCSTAQTMAGGVKGGWNDNNAYSLLSILYYYTPVQTAYVQHIKLFTITENFGRQRIVFSVTSTCLKHHLDRL